MNEEPTSNLMSHRTMRDSAGVEWNVWDVKPGILDRVGRRLTLRPSMAGGWLAFESSTGEKRRLTPVPDGWEEFPDAKLDVCRELTEPVPARR
jgi:hypothetical protein